MADEIDTRAEIDAHEDVIRSLRQMAKALVDAEEASSDPGNVESQHLRERLTRVEAEWQQLLEKSTTVRCAKGFNKPSF